MIENTPPIDIFPGESKEILISVINEDDPNLAPLDMSNASLIWELYREPMHIKILSKDNNGTDVLLQNAAGGVVQVNVNIADTEGLKIGQKYVYYLWVVDNYGRKSPVAKGGFNIKN